MLVQKHREYSISKENGCFAVGKSRDEVFADLQKYCKENKGKHIYMYEQPIRPSKTNYLPEYCLEIIKEDPNEHVLHIGYVRVQ